MLNFPIATFCIFSTKGDVIIRVCGIFSTLTFITKSTQKYSVLTLNFLIKTTCCHGVCIQQDQLQKGLGRSLGVRSMGEKMVHYMGVGV